MSKSSVSGYCSNFVKANDGVFEPEINVNKEAKKMKLDQEQEFYCLGCGRSFNLKRGHGFDKSITFANSFGEFEPLETLSQRGFNDSCAEFLRKPDERNDIFDEI